MSNHSVFDVSKLNLDLETNHEEINRVAESLINDSKTVEFQISPRSFTYSELETLDYFLQQIRVSLYTKTKEEELKKFSGYGKLYNFYGVLYVLNPEEVEALNLGVLDPGVVHAIHFSETTCTLYNPIAYKYRAVEVSELKEIPLLNKNELEKFENLLMDLKPCNFTLLDHLLNLVKSKFL